MRAGAHVLLMAADPINRGILRSVLDHPLEVGPGRAFKVTSGGREMLSVAFVVERWLQRAPQGALPFDSRQAEMSVATLAEGWSTTIVHMLAREPLTFRELQSSVVEELNQPELETRLAAMASVGQIEVHSDIDGEAIFWLTDWLRAGIAPLIASARLERRNPLEEMAPIDALDVEAGFRLSLPLIELPKELTGTCSLGLNLADDESASLTGVTAEIIEGQIASCTAGLNRKADAWAAATAAEWLDTVIEPDVKLVRTGGDHWTARAIIDRLHRTLFGVVGGGFSFKFPNKTD